MKGLKRPKLEEKELMPLTAEEEAKLIDTYSEKDMHECRSSHLHAYA